MIVIPQNKCSIRLIDIENKTLQSKGCAPKDAPNLKKAVYGWQGVPRRERPAFLLPNSGPALPAMRQMLSGPPHC